MSVWTEDRIARLKTLWPLGWSAQRIADVLGEDVTRSAVLGKVHRMKLSVGRSPASPVSPAVAAADALFAIAPDGEAQLVNYRQAGGLFIVDRVLDRAELRLGDRRPQVVRIRRLQGVRP